MRNNRAWSGGGIAGLYADITLIGAEMRDNWATMDGGGVLGKNGVLTARRTKFVANSAGNSGGAIYHYRSDLSARDVSIRGNRARVAGGGIHSWESPTSLERVTLDDNHAGQKGGALHIFFSTAELTNVTVSGNTAVARGGGIGNVGGVSKLVYATLFGNSAPLGGALYHNASGWSASTLTIKNTVLAHGGTGGNCSVGSGSITKIISDGHNLSSDATCRPYLNRTGDRNDRNPRLAPLADNGGFTLTHLPQDGSLAIDRGDCVATVGNDQRGVSRPQDGLCDIGSVEALSDSLLRAYLPFAGQHFR